MPVFRDAAPDARQRLVRTTKGYQQRQIYRDNLLGLKGGKTLEIEPRGDETIRKLKVNVKRAANELGMNVKYGETAEGTLLVWSEAAGQKRRRGRPPKA